jgi:hypothetical protein
MERILQMFLFVLAMEIVAPQIIAHVGLDM